MTDSPVPAPARDTTKDDPRRVRGFDEAHAILSDIDVDLLTIDECIALDTMEFYAREYVRIKPALDALAEAWNDPRYGQRMRQHITEGYPRLSAAIHTLTDSPTP